MITGTYFPARIEDDTRPLRWAVAVSILLHICAFAVISRLPQKTVEKQIEVTLISPPEKTAAKTAPMPPIPPAPQQMVAPSETKSEAPKDARFRSEHDSSAEKETVHRGDPLVKEQSKEQSKEAKEQPPAPAKTQTKAASQKAEPPKASSPKPAMEAKLRLNDEQLREALSTTVPSKTLQNDQQGEDDAERRQKFQSAQPFQQSINSSLFRGHTGSADYLPQIPDGDITMLNAKADRYAVFVRRVALQVFGALRKLNWQELSRMELRRLNKFVTVEAVMDKQGKLVKVILRDPSGSDGFDQIAQKAASAGTWDQNPPSEAAASDGMIHFVFEAKSWSRAAPNGLAEQRWLLLGTGLL